MENRGNWKKWALYGKLLEDGQLWETEDSLIQVERMGTESYRLVIFSAKKTGLHFLQVVFLQVVIYDNVDKIFNFFEHVRANPTSKVLMARRLHEK